MEIGLGSLVRQTSDIRLMRVTGEAGDDLFCVSEDGSLRAWFSRHELTRVMRRPMPPTTAFAAA